MNPRALSFGDLLRQHRVAAGLSQEGLAERTGLSADAVGLLERGARRRPQRHTLEVLADALALEGEDRERFLAAARQPPPAIELRMTDRLPRAPTPILGRERELETIATLLQAEVRLLTLTGPGGVGKTRLAIAAAERVCGTFADGVTFVSLAPIADPALLVSTIARALDVAEERGRPLQDTLEGALADRELLLVLDNFEHLAAAAPRVAELVAAAPRLRALVTSRARLRLRAERELAVLPLPVPSAAAPGDVAANPAVALYAARARAALVSFSLTPEVAHAVAAICRRLDGLPLAIELAAGRAKVLPPEALFARLEGGMAVLAAGPRDAPARHQSLPATLLWSHGLLQPAERALFRRLAVFRGGWTLESAEAVCGGDGLPKAAVLDGLAALADQSLVVPPTEGGADPRFDMLETIREYAAERLVESGETAAVRARHAANFLELATRSASGQSGSSARSELARLDAEHDNLRAALHWAEETRDARLGLGLAAALAEFWFFRAHYAEGRAWLERFLTTSDARASGEENARAGTTRARALEGLAALVYNQGDYGRAAALYEESIATYREASDSVGAARALTRLGGVARDAGDRGRAATLLEESLGL